MAHSEDLVSWLMPKLKDWEDHRNSKNEKRWNEYQRLWRGMWSVEDKNRDSERSRLIAPALSQAIEATVAELEEATFGGSRWFDVVDNTADEDETDIAMFRDQLKEDMENANIPSAISEMYLNGCLFGTGIGKLIVEEVPVKRVVPNTVGDSFITTMGVSSSTQVQVSLVAVHPKEFLIDPSARTIDEALGCAHVTVVPKWTVEKKIAEGIYMPVSLEGFNDNILEPEKDNGLVDATENADKTLLIEYHGLVPRQLLFPEEEDGVEPLFEGEGDASFDESDLVEAIVTIANGSTLLRAVENPFEMKDRAFLAYQHDTVPNSFWGRGVAEKGYNPQKALDAEMRGRIDAMALTIHPMMAVDAARIPKGHSLSIRPGRMLLTNGDPKATFMPLTFGQVNNNTFSQTGELERMVQMGTGAMDSATPLAENRRNETSSGMSMIMSGAVKRSKRTLANIERMFMKPLIHKTAWRYMQLAPDRYPSLDVTFVPHSTLGIMARELEQQQLSGLMATVPPESPAFWLLLKGIYENSSISNRDEMVPIIDAMMQASIEKQGQEEENPLVAIKAQEIMLNAQIEDAKLKAKMAEDSAEAQLALEKLKLQHAELKLREREIMLDHKVDIAKVQQASVSKAAELAQNRQIEEAKLRQVVEKAKPKEDAA